MSARTLTLTLRVTDGRDGGVRSGDDAAEALRSVADYLANRWDGMTLPDDGGSILLTGARVGEWAIQ
jgi:hypothetical protein